MTEFIVGVGSALWLGILTSISPCPLATNIAAISYIGRKVGNSRQVFLTGLLYTVGRTLAYLALAVVLVASVLSIPQISLFLQKYMHLALGPLLIVVGMFLLGLIELNMGGGGMSEGLQKRVDAMGIWGALLLGDRLRADVLPHIGRPLLWKPGAVIAQGEFERYVAHGVRRRDRVAGDCVCSPAGHQRSIRWQSLQRTGQDRVVGSDADGRDFRARRHLLLAQVCFPGDLTMVGVAIESFGASLLSYSQGMRGECCPGTRFRPGCGKPGGSFGSSCRCCSWGSFSSASSASSFQRNGSGHGWEVTASWRAFWLP